MNEPTAEDIEKDDDRHLANIEFFLFYASEFGTTSSPLNELRQDDPTYMYFNIIPDYLEQIFKINEDLVPYLEHTPLLKRSIAWNIGKCIIKAMEDRALTLAHKDKDTLIRAVLNPLIQTELYFNEKPGFEDYKPEAVAVLFTEGIVHHKDIRVRTSKGSIDRL